MWSGFVKSQRNTDEDETLIRVMEDERTGHSVDHVTAEFWTLIGRIA